MEVCGLGVIDVMLRWVGVVFAWRVKECGVIDSCLEG